MNSPLPEGWDFSRHFTSPFFPGSHPFPFPFPFSQWSRCHAFLVGRRGPADWHHLGHGDERACMQAHTGSCTHMHTTSGTRVYTLCMAGLSAQHVPQPGAPSRALGDGPTRLLMLEVSQRYRNPSVLCSQLQKPGLRANDANKPSSHLPGEVLKGRSAHRASFFFMQLQPQPGPVPPCVLSADVHTSQSGHVAVYQHLLSALQHLGPGFV